MSRLFSPVLVALALLLAGCGQQAAGLTGDAAARDAFLKERAGTPIPGLSGDMVGGGGVFGEVEKVEGNDLTVKNPMNGETTLVRLAEGGVVRKQADAQMSDVKAGETITAFGTKDGDTLAAEMVNVGGEGGRPVGTGPVQVQRAQGGDAAGGSAHQGTARQSGGKPPTAVAGTVKSVEDSAITVEAEDGTTTTVEVTDGTRLRKQVEVLLSEIEPGMQVSAAGEKRGDVFEATEISVIEMMMIER